MTAKRSEEALAVRAAPVVANRWGWRYPARKAWALRDVSLTITPGERVLLAGASGSGKSTLMSALAGVLDPEGGESEGSLTIDGQSPTAADLRGSSGLVQQDPDSQIVMARLGDEVAFGLENLGVPQEQIWPRVRDALDSVGLTFPLDHPTSELSGGQKQRLALACALAMRPGTLLLDEPTANLDPEGAESLRHVVRDVVDRTGATLVIVEHNLEPWLNQVDRIIVLRGGRVIADGAVDEVLADQADQLRRDGVWVPGETTEELLASAAAEASWGDAFNAEPPLEAGERLSCDDLTIGYSPDEPPVNSDITLSFGAAEVTSIIGDNGTGKTTLALTLAGLLRPLSGDVAASDRLRSAAGSGLEEPLARGKRGRKLGPDPNTWTGPELLGRISMVFQEPAYQFVCNTVEEELLLGPKLAKPDAAVGSGAREEVDRLLALLHLEHLRKAHPLSLSGGEKRRLSVATALISAPRVLILDEPTFGQDRNTWAALVLLLRRVAARGTTVISVTHDARFVAAMGGRTIPLRPATRAELVADEGPSTAPAVKVGARRGWIDRVNPFAQLVGLLLLTMPLIVTIDVVSAAFALGAELLLLPILGMRPKAILQRVWPLLVAAPLTVLSMLLYAKPGGTIYFHFGVATVSANSLHLALAVGLRVLAVGLPAILILSRIDSTAMADALTQVGRLPARLVLSALTGVRMITLMTSDWKALERARRSRGLGSGNRLVAFFRGAFALLAFAIRRAGTLSLTMEARGFGGTRPRSNARNSTLSRADAVCLAGCVAVPAAALALAVATGQFRWFGL